MSAPDMCLLCGRKIVYRLVDGKWVKVECQCRTH